MPIQPSLWYRPKPTIDEHLGGFQADQFTGLPLNLLFRLSPTLPMAMIFTGQVFLKTNSRNPRGEISGCLSR